MSKNKLKENLLGIVGQTKPVGGILISKSLHPGEELVSADPLGHLDRLSVATHLDINVKIGGPWGDISLPLCSP